MTENQQESEEGSGIMTAADKELWHRARTAWSEAPLEEDEPDPLVLAAYLEGRLDPGESADLEARLAADPAALELLTASGQALAAGPDAAVPEGLLRRAEGLVRAQPATEPEAGLLARLRGFFDLPTQAAWGSFAAALVIACVAGYEIGYQSMDSGRNLADLPVQEGAVGLDTMAGPLL